MKTRGEWNLTAVAAGLGVTLSVGLAASLLTAAVHADASAQAAPGPTTSATAPTSPVPDGVPSGPGDAAGHEDPQPDPDRGSDQEPQATPGSTAPAEHELYGPRIYEIERGDTLAEISLKTGVSVQHLAEVNHIDDVDWIYAGSALVVPEVEASASID